MKFYPYATIHLAAAQCHCFCVLPLLKAGKAVRSAALSYDARSASQVSSPLVEQVIQNHLTSSVRICSKRNQNTHDATREAVAAPCAVAIEQAAAAAGTPNSILQAIGSVESSGRPWAINDAGRSYVFGTRAEASAFLREQIERGRTNLDIGCLQINWHWHGDQLGNLDAALDPFTNALYAASYLRSLYDALGSWSGAVGAYHSRHPDRAEGYRCRVAKALQPARPISNCP